MNPDYKPLYDQVVSLQHQFNDALQPDHPMSTALRSEVQELVTDVRENKNPRDIENRVKTIQQQLIQAQAQGDSVMNAERVDYFHNNFQRMQMDLRKFDTY